MNLREQAFLLLGLGIGLILGVFAVAHSIVWFPFILVAIGTVLLFRANSSRL